MTPPVLLGFSMRQEVLWGPWHWGTAGRGADRDPQVGHRLAAEPPNTHAPASPRTVHPASCTGRAPRAGFQSTHRHAAGAASAVQQLTPRVAGPLRGRRQAATQTDKLLGDLVGRNRRKGTSRERRPRRRRSSGAAVLMEQHRPAGPTCGRRLRGHVGCWQGVGPPPGHVRGFPVGEVSVHFVHFARVCSGASVCAWGRAGLRRGLGGNHQGRASPPPGVTVTPGPPGISDAGWAVSPGKLADGDALLLAPANTGLPHATLEDGWPPSSEGNEDAHHLTTYHHVGAWRS